MHWQAPLFSIASLDRNLALCCKPRFHYYKNRTFTLFLAFYKRSAEETSKSKLEEAGRMVREAEEVRKQAAEQTERITAQAQKTVEAVQKECSNEVEKAMMARNQAQQERDDARTIAEEKTASNDILMRQLAAMEADVTAYKLLQEEHAKLLSEYAEARGKCREDLRDMAEQLKDARKDAEHREKELNGVIDRLKEEVSQMQTENVQLRDDKVKLTEKVETLTRQMIEADGEAKVAQERAVMDNERSMQNLLRQADRENAVLTAQLEKLKAEIASGKGQ